MANNLVATGPAPSLREVQYALEQVGSVVGSEDAYVCKVVDPTNGPAQRVRVRPRAACAAHCKHWLTHERLGPPRGSHLRGRPQHYAEVVRFVSQHDTFKKVELTTALKTQLGKEYQGAVAIHEIDRICVQKRVAGATVWSLREPRVVN